MKTTSIPLSVFFSGVSGSYPGFEPGHELMDHVPSVNQNYRFNADNLRDMLVFIANNDGDGLFLSGPTGCGKTSLILETAGRLNWPVRRINAHSRMELHEIVGSMALVPVKGGGTSTVFRYGPLAQAMKEGSLFILDEMDTLDPAVANGLNAVLEGNPLVIADNGGEVVKAHPNFRFIATGNTAGMGDDSGAYAATQQQNLAFLDRFWIVTVGYPDESVEQSILEAMFSDTIEAGIRNKMIKVANLVREQFVGTGNSGATLSITFSTRTLIRWSNMLISYSQSKISGSRLEYTLDRCLTMRARPHEREAVIEIAKNVFGNTWQ